jgi:hypothetical protein
MNNYYLDVCGSKELADMRLAYHAEKKRLNPKKEQVAAATATKVTGQPDTPQVKTCIAAEGDDLWIVTAEEPAE